MPPRNPLGVVAGVLKSPCASIQATCTSGSRSTTSGSVAMQIEQSDAVSTGSAPASNASRTAAAAASSTGRAAGRSSLQSRTAGSPGSPTTVPPSARASASRARARPGRAVRRAAADAPHLPVHTGSRFSKNAFTPSWMSSVENASVSCARR